MFGSTNQSCYNCFRWGPMRGSRKFCQRGSNSATLTTFFFFSFFKRREDPNITKIGPSSAPQRNAVYRAIVGPPAKRHLNGVWLGCRWWPNVECWLGSFENFRGSGPVLLRYSLFLWFSGPPDPCPAWDWPMYTENPSYCAHRLCVLSIACTNFSIGETFFP